MSIKEILALSDCKELKQMIIENPEAALLVFAGEEAWNGNYAYESNSNVRCRIDEVTLLGVDVLSKDGFEEELRWSPPAECDDMTDAEFDEYVKKRIETQEFVKVIAIYVG